MTNTETNITELTQRIDAHLLAYAMPDPERRAQLVADSWSADGQLCDPPLEGRGHAEIAGLADVVVAHYPGHRFERTTDVDAHHGFARYGWRLVAPDGSTAITGVDFAEVDDAGTLLRIVGFFNS